MGYLSDEIERESRTLGIEVQVMPAPEMEHIRDRVYSCFSTGDRTYQTPLRDLLVYYESLHDPDGWQLLRDLIGDMEVVVFFDLSTDPSGLRFAHGWALQSVIEECTGLQFYVTDRQVSYVMCLTDDDMLLASGSMASRLREVLGEE